VTQAWELFTSQPKLALIGGLTGQIQGGPGTGRFGKQRARHVRQIPYVDAAGRPFMFVSWVNMGPFLLKRRCAASPHSPAYRGALNSRASVRAGYTIPTSHQRGATGFDYARTRGLGSSCTLAKRTRPTVHVAYRAHCTPCVPRPLTRAHTHTYTHEAATVAQRVPARGRLLRGLFVPR
jgi:hypothetical protein